jgi:DNA-binding transcriptional ArsR family regulator
MDKFRVLGSKTRRKMLEILARKELHISGLAKELGISVPVTAKHVGILEKEGLIERKKFGRTHVLSANTEKLDGLLDTFVESLSVQVRKGSSVLDVLKKTSGVEFRKTGDKEFVVSVNGEDGYYIYEVDGTLPNVPMDEFLLTENAKVKLKKLVPVGKKDISVKIK